MNDNNRMETGFLEDDRLADASLERMERRLAFEAKIAEAEADTQAGRVRPLASVQRSMRAKPVSVKPATDISKCVGAMKGKWDGFDYESFQALDAEIADLMGT